MNEVLVYHIIKESILNSSRENCEQYRLDINVNRNYILGDYIIYKTNKLKYSARVYYHYYMYLSVLDEL